MSPNGYGAGFRWDRDLEGPAYDIAVADESPLRVLAGPGTGKTFSVMRRVARLLQEDGHPPERIFLCTFARTAARDLQAALQDLEIEAADDVYASTLHAFCYKVLRRDQVLEATGRVPRTLMKYERRFLVEDLRHQDDEFGGVRSTRNRLEAFKAAWARRLTDEPGWADDPVDQRFEQELERWLRLHRGMLIGEVVPLTLEYLRNNPMAPPHQWFDTLLVDEYQDLNRAEQELLEILADGSTLTIVGDEDQSIYSFKYAHPEGVEAFAERHDEVRDERLEDCRRCPRLIVRLASRLIRENERRADRGFEEWPENPEGIVNVVQWRRRLDEAHGLARLIEQKIDRGEVDRGEVLVLTQSRDIGSGIQAALDEQGVPAHNFFADQALKAAPTSFEGSEAQRALSLLTLAANPRDRVALRCWCGFGSSTLYSGGWRRIMRRCEESGASPRVVLQEMDDGTLELPHQDGPLERYRALEERLDEVDELEGEELVEYLFPANQEWAKPFRSYAAEIEAEGFGHRRLYSELKTAITQPEPPMDVDYVRVMSLHKSKGLSADLVVIAGCMHGIIPRKPDDDATPEEEQAHLEEQRRLFYVGITRTKRELLISSFRSIDWGAGLNMGLEMRGGNRDYGRTIASPFLTDMGPELPDAVPGNRFLQAEI